MELTMKKELPILIGQSPEPIDSDLFLEWNENYRKRRDNNSVLEVDMSSDKNYLTFTGTTIEDLLGKADENDCIVFRFICDSEENKFSGLNITPVIMNAGLTKIKHYSDVKGDGISLNGQTSTYISNYQTRKKILKNIPGFQNETCGIVYSAAGFAEVFKYEMELSIYFMLDNFPQKPSKTTIAISPFNNSLEEIPDPILITIIKIFDHGSECC